jgi:AcrR family transcriptional regulator
MTTSDDGLPSVEGEASTSAQPQGRRGQRQLQTRAQLIAGARNIFARVGVAEATIAQITSEANVGFGTFYLYFKTKDDALHAVLVEGFAQLNVQIDELLRHANEQQQLWEDTLKDIVIAYLRFANENRDLVQIMLAEQTRSQQTDWQVFLRFAWRIVLLLQRAQPSFAEAIPRIDAIPGGPGAHRIAYPLNLLTAMIVAILNRSAVWWLRQHPLESSEHLGAASPSLDAVGALVAQFIIAGLTSVLTTREDKTRKDQGNDDTEHM